MFKKIFMGVLCIMVAFSFVGCALSKSEGVIVNNCIVFSNLFPNDPEVFGKVYFNNSYVVGGTEVELILLADDGYDYMQGTLRYLIAQEPGLILHYISDSNITIGQPFSFVVPEITHKSINSPKDKWNEPLTIKFLFNLIEL